MTSKKEPSKIRPGPARAKRIEQLPVYDSIAACSAATGIPVAALKAAKKKGCNAFEHSRVDLGLFLGFIFSRDGQDIQKRNWSEYKTEGEAKRIWLKLEKEEGNVISRSTVVDGLAQLASAIDSNLEKVFCNEFPAAVVGLQPLAISKLAKEYKGRVWATLKEYIKLMEPEKTNDEQSKV